MTIALMRDRAGFPLIAVDGFYLHWLPVTKIQFEDFLCDARDRSFGKGWYETILALNPRVTPRQISPDNYWNALLSGVLPAEAQRYAFWCGDGFRVPSAWEWSRAYRALSTQPAVDLEEAGVLVGLQSRDRELFLQAEAAATRAAAALGYERHLADQMLMRLGVVEWVTVEDRWGGMGEPFPGFCGNLLTPDAGTPILPRQAQAVRAACFGFRLLWRENAGSADLPDDERRS